MNSPNSCIMQSSMDPTVQSPHHHTTLISWQAEPVLQAAGVLSALAVAGPSSAALLLQECLEKLAAQVQQLTTACAPHTSSPRGIRDADDSSTTIRLLKDSVLGFANGAAALVSAATR